MIDKIFDAVWPVLKDKFGSIEMAKEVGEKYRLYIIEQYAGSLELIHDKDDKLVLKYIESIIRDEKEKIMGLNCKEIQNLFELDESYDEFLLLSSSIFEQAKRKKDQALLPDNLENYETRKSKILTLFDSITEKNREAASDILSEMLVEIDYIYGISDNESFRLAREIPDVLNDDVFGNFGEFGSTFKIDEE